MLALATFPGPEIADLLGQQNSNNVRACTVWRSDVDARTYARTYSAS